MQPKLFTSESFSARLTELMARRGWNQRDLAVHAELSQPSISRYLRGQTEPKITDVIALAKALGSTVDVLIGVATEPLKGSLNEEPTEYVNWRDRALSAETKVEMLKSGMQAHISKL